MSRGEQDRHIAAAQTKDVTCTAPSDKTDSPGTLQTARFHNVGGAQPGNDGTGELTAVTLPVWLS